MPDMDGYETTVKLRELGFLDTPIIALTANAMQGDREKCLEAGMSDYLPKPLRPDELRAVLKKWLDPEDSASPESDRQAKSTAVGEFIDLAELEEIFRDNMAMIPKLIDEFKSSLGESLDNIEIAAQAPERIEDLRLHSHTVKGMAANFGASPLNAAAAKVEEACRNDSFEEARELVAAVAEMSNRTLEELRKLGY